ncbi:MAG: alpha/beta hydrolase [Armatimonadetes bacterium]|nr:alpha/beta hydrolase [Armatimonadota bacterium]
MERWRTYMLPGLGADGRLFTSLAPHLAEPSTPKWIEPSIKESLSDYSFRFAESLDLSRPFVVVGFSFGGQVAMEAAARHEGFREACRGILLVSSCRNQEAITKQFASRVQLMRYLPDAFLRTGLVAFSARFSPTDPLTKEQRAWLQEMAESTDLSFFRWAAGACSDWGFAGPHTGEGHPAIHQIHGGKDDIIPLVPGHAEVVWDDAGHLLTYTHPEQIAEALDRLTQPAGASVLAERVRVR